MPTVPTRNRQIAEQPIPSVRPAPSAPIGAFGGGEAAENVSRATNQLLGNVAKFAMEEKEKADQLAVLEADKKLSELETRLQYDPQSGAMLRKGKDAFTLPDDVKKSWDKEVENINGGLSNQSQKGAFKRMAVSRWGDLDRNIQRYVAGQIKEFDDTTTDSYLANERNAATLNYLEAARIGLSIERQRAALIDHARRNGLPEEWVKLKVADATSKTHTSVINRMLANGDDRIAQQYFAANRDGVSGEDVSKIEKVLEEGSLRGESQRMGDEIIGKTKNLEEALEEVKKIKDPKLREAVNEFVVREANQRKAAKAEARNDLYMQATNIIDNNRGADPRRILPPAMWEDLTLEQRNALENRASDVQNDDKRWLEFRTLTMPQVAALNQSDFETRYWSKFDKPNRERAIEIWKAAKDGMSGSANSQYAFKSIFTEKDMILNAMRNAKVAGTTPEDTSSEILKSDAKTAAFNLLQERANTEFQSFHAAMGKNPNDEMKQKIINDMVLKTVFINKPLWRDEEKPIGALTKDEQARIYKPIADIPAKARFELVNIARANGMIRPDVTDDRAMVLLQEKIERAYAARLAGASIPRLIEIMTEE